MLDNRALAPVVEPITPRSFSTDALQKRRHRARTRFRPVTYAQYKNWPEDVRCEIIDGIPYMLAAPSLLHQGISMELSRIFANFLDDKPCRVYAAPVDVRLFAEMDEAKDKEDDKDVFQPDLLVICDKTRQPDPRKAGASIKGAPDLVIEILSPSNRSLDLNKKFVKYCEAGVEEYWVIDPPAKTITVYTSGGDTHGSYFVPHIYGEGDAAPVKIWRGALSVDVSALFEKAARYA
jgi:Uma2 family endonuclease